MSSYIGHYLSFLVYLLRFIKNEKNAFINILSHRSINRQPSSHHAIEHRLDGFVGQRAVLQGGLSDVLKTIRRMSPLRVWQSTK